jgi:hypothetical protein
MSEDKEERAGGERGGGVDKGSEEQGGAGVQARGRRTLLGHLAL